MSITEELSLNIISIAPNIGCMKESVEKIVKSGKTYEPGIIESWMNTIYFWEDNYNDQIDKLKKSKGIILDEYSIDSYYNNIYKVYNS